MYPKHPFPGLVRESPPAAKSLLRRSVGVVVALTVLGGWLSLPAYAEGGSAAWAPLSLEQTLSVIPMVSPQFLAGDELLPEQPVAPQPEAAPPASIAPAAQLASGPTASGLSAGADTRLARTGFGGIWLLPLAGGLVLLGVLFAIFASRKQRRDEEQLAAEQAELARQAALAELANRAALSELEELEKLEQASAERPEAPDVPRPPTVPDDRVHPVQPRGPAERVGPFVSFPDDRVGPDNGADSHEENGKRPDAR